MGRRRQNRSPRLVLTPRPRPLRDIAVRRVLERRSLPGDRRFFHPLDVLRPVVAAIRSARRLVPARKPVASRMPVAGVDHRLAFAVPKKVMVCVRRKQRKEVLHAMKRTHKGAGSKKRRNIWSEVSC